jgi:Zn-dependent protease
VIELIVVFVGLLVYACLPSALKEKIVVKVGILVLVVGWFGYSQVASGLSWPQLGIRTDDWFAGIRPVILLMVVGVIIMLLFAALRTPRTLKWNSHMTISALLYPLFGFAQQFLILGYLNMKMTSLGWSPIPIAIVTAIAFMLLHVPNRWLMPATVVLGFIFSLLYQHEPNLIAFGIAHGWLGLLYYFWVMDEDPIQKIVEQLRGRGKGAIARKIGYPVLAIGSAVVTWFGIYAMRSYLLPFENASFAAAVLFVILLVHEMGHWLAMARHRMYCLMVFTPLIGGVIFSKKIEAQVEELPWYEQMHIFLAGVYGQFVFVGISCALTLLQQFTVSEFQIILLLNGWIILINLIPLGFLDGGRFIRKLLQSTPRVARKEFVIRLGIFVFGFGGVVNFIFKTGFFFLLLVYFWSLMLTEFKLRKERASEYDWRALDYQQRRKSYLLYIGCLTIAFVLFGFSKS